MLLFMVSFLHAQQGFVSSGGDLTGNGSVSFSMGQNDFISATGSGGSVSQGIQQPHEIFLSGLPQYTPTQWRVFPNPALDEFFIYWPGRYLKVELSDSRGRVVLKHELKDHDPISLSGLARGIYFVKLEAGMEAPIHFKLIKQ